MVISTVNQVIYNGDGITTAWPYTFRIIDDTDIKLTIIDADGTETDVSSDYYVDMVNKTVYYPGYAPGAEPPEADQPPVLSANQKLIVYRTLPITQEKDLGDKWPFAVIELGLDKLTMILQDIWDWCGRCLQVTRGRAVEVGDDFDPTVPLEAGKVICGNAAGDGFEAREALMEVNGAWDGEGRQIHSVADPTGDQDAATKNYVDTLTDNNFMKLQPDGEAWEGRNLPISNVAGPALIKDAANKDYVDRILAGYSGQGDRFVFFDNVAQMQAAGLVPSQMAVTLGYYDVNDGGAGVYTIRDKGADTPDGGSIIEIPGTDYVAELIVNNTVSVKQFGAKGDGVTDDADAIQKACDSKYDVIFGYRETYYINKKVTLKNNKTYDFNNSALVLDEPIYNEVTTALDSNNCIRHYISTELFHDRTGDYVAGYTTKRLNGTDVTENLLGTYTFSTVEDYELSILTIKNVGNITSNLPGTDYAFYIRFTQLTIDNANAQDVDNYNLFGISCCVDTIVKNCTMNIIAKNYSVLYPFMVICCNNTSFQNCNISNDVWHCLSVGGNQGVSLFTKYINCYLFGSFYESIGEHENALFSIVDNCVINGALLATGATIQNTKILHSLAFFGMFNNSKNIVRDIIVDNCDINNDKTKMFLCYSSADIINKVIVQNSKLNKVDFDAVQSGSFAINWTVNDWILNGCAVTGNVTIYNVADREMKHVYISNCKIDGELLDGNHNVLETDKRVCMGCDVTGNLYFSGRIINCIARSIFGFYVTNCVYTTILSASRINNNNITGAIS